MMSRFPFAHVLLGFCAVWLASTGVGRINAEPINDAVNAELAYHAEVKDAVAKVYANKYTPSDRKLLQASDQKIEEKQTDLIYAIVDNNVKEFNKALKFLTKRGLSLDFVVLIPGDDEDDDPFTTTPLETAVLFDNARFVEKLIEEGADPNVESRFSVSPNLLTAVSRGNEEIVRILVDAGADVDEGKGSLTPLSIAAIDGRSDIIEILLEAEASTFVPGRSITAEDLVCSCADSDDPSERCDLDACEDPNKILELFEDS